jgi:hypothetical protein
LPELQSPDDAVRRQIAAVARALRLPPDCAMSGNKRFIYVLKHAEGAPRFYVGLTSDVDARLLITTEVLVHIPLSIARGGFTSSSSSQTNRLLFALSST